MPQIIENKTVFSLLEVANSIQKTLRNRYQSTFWVQAEMNKLNYYKHSGHCYPELVHKNENKVIAQIRAHIWKEDYIRINRTFLTMLNEPLKDGIKVLCQARITFDPSYGLSLRITDIDPTYTLGDLEKEKQECIQRLQDEVLFNKNKTKELPLLPQRIAVISVETSKGYADFLSIVDKNPWKYKFFHCLFPALLQGDKAVNSINAQLKKIRKVIRHFDAVAIIRGGGGTVGLSCYNNYYLAREIALFHIPVLTGIGHAGSETVVEMISHSNAITPSKLAEYLIQKFHNFSVPLKDAEKSIIKNTRHYLLDEKSRFHSEIKMIRSSSEKSLVKHHHAIRNQSYPLIQNARFLFRKEFESVSLKRKTIYTSSINMLARANEKNRRFAFHVLKDIRSTLDHNKYLISRLSEIIQSHSRIRLKNMKTLMNNIARNLDNMDPQNILKRGYSITSSNGKALKDVSETGKGDTIKTRLFSGEIISIVESIKKSGK